MEDLAGEQQENSKVPEQLRPFQYKKGQSGNPSGRPKGISLKEYAKLKFLTMTDDEKEEFLHGLPKDIIWKQAEGNPENNDKLKVESKVVNKVALEINEDIKELFRRRNKS